MTMVEDPEVLQKIIKTREYLNYIEEHILNTKKAWAIIKKKCEDMEFVFDHLLCDWIEAEVKFHDMSKLSEEEFVQYRKFFYPTELEKRKEKYDITDAWFHHLKCNGHHWENLEKEKDCHEDEWIIRCVHMVVDWVAMGFKFGDTAQQYYERNKANIKISKIAENLIYAIFNRLAK